MPLSQPRMIKSNCLAMNMREQAAAPPSPLRGGWHAQRDGWGCAVEINPARTFSTIHPHPALRVDLPAGGRYGRTFGAATAPRPSRLLKGCAPQGEGLEAGRSLQTPNPYAREGSSCAASRTMLVWGGHATFLTFGSSTYTHKPCSYGGV